MGAALLCGTNGISKHNKYLFCLVFIVQLLSQLGVKDGQQPIVHPLHVRLRIVRPVGRHHLLLRQHPARRQTGNFDIKQARNIFQLCKRALCGSNRYTIPLRLDNK
jgi:hypothetical protein